MDQLLLWIGRLAGLAGAVVCAAAVIIRMSGGFVAGGFQVGTLLQVGIAAMVLACLAYLAVLAERRHP